MKQAWIWIVVVIVVVVAIVGYTQKETIKAMMGGSSPQPAVQVTTNPQPTSSSSASAPTSNIYTVKTDPTKGKYLADFQGMTLYTYDKDTAGVSNCDGGCAKAWPPYTSGATAESDLPTNITVITRTDGSKQFAWKGMPLYYYASDQKAGDIMGDGVGGIWHIVTP